MLRAAHPLAVSVSALEKTGLGQLARGVADNLGQGNVEATLEIEGSVRALPADAGFALYRGAQKALTNVARYAPGAATTVPHGTSCGSSIFTSTAIWGSSSGATPMNEEM